MTPSGSRRTPRRVAAPRPARRSSRSSSRCSSRVPVNSPSARAGTRTIYARFSSPRGGRTASLEYGASPMYGAPTGPRLLWPLDLLPPGFAGAMGEGSRPRSLARLLIEAITFQATFVHDLLSRTNLPAVGVRPDRDKVTRARALAARYEAGKVFHLRGAPGITSYEDELVAFPNGAHDDQVHAAVYGAELRAPLSIPV